MATIGIVCPLWVEAQPLLAWHPQPHLYKFHKRTWIRLECESHTFVVVVSKIGCQKTATATQLLLDHHRPKIVINFGTAGAIASHIQIGDMVIGTATAEYESPVPYSELVETSLPLLNAAKSFLWTHDFYQAETVCHLGPIVSADRNIENPEQKQYLWQRYQALCGDWESAVVMRICRDYGIPAIPFRVVTDYGEFQVKAEFMEHHQKVLEQAAQVLKNYCRVVEKELP